MARQLPGSGVLVGPKCLVSGWLVRGLGLARGECGEQQHTEGASRHGVVIMSKGPLHERFFLVVMLSLVCTPIVAAAQSDEMFCSGDEVAEALDELECASDGVYLSPETLADEISYRCGDASSERACRACFNKERAKLQIAFRAVAKVGLIDRSAARRLKATFAHVTEETCTGLDEDQPLPDEAEDSPKSSPKELVPPVPPPHRNAAKDISPTSSFRDSFELHG